MLINPNLKVSEVWGGPNRLSNFSQIGFSGFRRKSSTSERSTYDKTLADE